jgi:glutamine amidotransferase
MAVVAIIDYGLCNLDSVARAIEECGGKAQVTDKPEDLAGADRIVLPGVGAFGEAIKRLHDRGLDEALEVHVRERGLPFLGICLGMHLLATESLEGGICSGLGWIDGTVRRLNPTSASPPERVPHVGWNQIELTRPCRLFEGISPTKDFYFTHSFHLDCEEPLVIAAWTPHCGGFVSGIEQDNILAVQFHPEKSQRAGFAVLRNFLGG